MPNFKSTAHGAALVCGAVCIIFTTVLLLRSLFGTEPSWTASSVGDSVIAVLLMALGGCMIWLGANGSVSFSPPGKVRRGSDATGEEGLTRLREAFGTSGAGSRHESQEPAEKALRR
jgi:hypothetical protein